MMKQMKTIIVATMLMFTVSMGLAAEVAKTNSPAIDKSEFTIVPKVVLDAGYVTRANHLGLQIQKNSAFVASSVSLENSIATPQVGVKYYFGRETAQQTVLDANLSHVFGGDKVALRATGGVEKRIIDGSGDTFTTYGEFRLEKFPILTVLATPYVSVARDFESHLFGTTIGLDRDIKLGKLEVVVTPRLEAYIYDKHTSYLAGGTIGYTGIKYVKPYIDLSYVTSDTAVAARKFEGNFALTTGVKFSF